MRYRALSATGDYTFASGQTAFLVNSPQAVGQAVYTRLRLLLGEWFLDTSMGVPYETDVEGFRTGATRDPAIQNTILGTQGVLDIAEYSSELDAERGFTVACTIDTIYGPAEISVTINPFTENALYNNGGVLSLTSSGTYPTAPTLLSPGAIWSDGLVVAVISGITPNPSAPPVYYGAITSVALLALGGGNLPLTMPGDGSGQLWNNGGLVCVA